MSAKTPRVHSSRTSRRPALQEDDMNEDSDTSCSIERPGRESKLSRVREVFLSTPVARGSTPIMPGYRQQRPVTVTDRVDVLRNRLKGTPTAAALAAQIVADGNEDDEDRDEDRRPLQLRMGPSPTPRDKPLRRSSLDTTPAPSRLFTERRTNAANAGGTVAYQDKLDRKQALSSARSAIKKPVTHDGNMDSPVAVAERYLARRAESRATRLAERKLAMIQSVKREAAREARRLAAEKQQSHLDLHRSFAATDENDQGTSMRAAWLRGLFGPAREPVVESGSLSAQLAKAKEETRQLERKLSCFSDSILAQTRAKSLAQDDSDSDSDDYTPPPPRPVAVSQSGAVASARKPAQDIAELLRKDPVRTEANTRLQPTSAIVQRYLAMQKSVSLAAAQPTPRRSRALSISSDDDTPPRSRPLSRSIADPKPARVRFANASSDSDD